MTGNRLAVVPATYVKFSTMVDGTLRVVLDIEPKNMADAIGLFSKPGAPVAVARLTDSAAVAADRDDATALNGPVTDSGPKEMPRLPSAPASERKPLPLASKVALTCREASFHSFLRKDPGLLGTYWCDARNEASECSDDAARNDSALAEAAVKKFCGVIRKRQIAERPQAVERWKTILASYEDWQRGAA